MENRESHRLLIMDQEDYQKQFPDTNLGLDLATKVAVHHGFTDIPVRIPEGSSLVFKLGPENFLKLTPPFYDDSVEAEILATKVIGDQLSFPIPKIVASGSLGSWKYIINKAVPGIQAKDIFGKMNAENRMAFASVLSGLDRHKRRDNLSQKTVRILV
jgi:hypothetical protein